MIRPTIHLKIIGSIWLISALVSGANRAMELWAFARNQSTSLGSDAGGPGFWVLQSLVEVSFLAIALIGLGLIWRPRRAVVAGAVWGTISLAICVWFITTQGMQHGPEPYVAIWCGVVLSLYTLFAVWRFGLRQKPMTNAR